MEREVEFSVLAACCHERLTTGAGNLHRCKGVGEEGKGGEFPRSLRDRYQGMNEVTD